MVILMQYHTTQLEFSLRLKIRVTVFKCLDLSVYVVLKTLVLDYFKEHLATFVIIFI